jgi:2-C-methyl-D-erythritol 4-phosphate cytidylyltransferase
MNANPRNDPTMATTSEQASPSPHAVPSDRLWALVPCAGQGLRAATAVPKQYHPVAGRALVLHTLTAFAGVSRLAHTLVLLAPGDTAFARLDLKPLPGCSAVDCGAATRAGTVRNGLAALRERGAQDHDWVLVHDAARCLVTPALIDRLIDACSDEAVGALLAVPVSDTVKRAADGRVAQTVDRSLYWLAQTPQMFRLGTLAQALQGADATVTDESSAIEALGLKPRLVEGDRANFKVTVAQDFAMAEAILRAREQAAAQEKR